VSICHQLLGDKYNPITTNILKRLTYELEVILKMGYADYFLVVWDIIQWANKQGIPTVGRGSVSGSIVSYVLGLTPVDPIKYKLLFERFLNPARRELPDIDIDVCWKRRDEVIQYIYNRYGNNKVAMISTFNTYRHKSAIWDVARAMGIPSEEINKLISMSMEQYENIRNEKYNSQYRRIVNLAKYLEGRPRHMGTHCGGIIISPNYITDHVPLQQSIKGPVVTQFDMHSIKKIGLVKIDILGQRSLTVIAEVADTIQNKYNIHLDRYIMSDIDEKTAKLIRNGDTIGVFQIESPGIRSLLKKLQVDTFEMIIVASSVIRPGPADSGMLRHFIERHHRKKDMNIGHKSLMELLKDTYGIMVYQEDVIKTAEVIAGWSLHESDELRRSMSGKEKKETFAKHRARFIRDAVKRGVSVEETIEIWRQMETFSGYAFCKAHAASYATLSVQSAWLKAHFPAEFMAAVISNHGGFYNASCYVEEVRRHGIVILPPDVNMAKPHCIAEDIKANSVLHKKNRSDKFVGVRIGLLQVKGLTRITLKKLLGKRKERPFESLEDFCIRAKPNFGEVERLIRCGSFDTFGYTRPQHLWRLKLFYNKIKTNDDDLFASIVKYSLPIPRVDYPIEKKLRDELEFMGLTLEKHPLWIWKKAIQFYINQFGKFVHAKDLHRYTGKKVKLVAWIISTNRTKTKKGEPMLFVSCEDLTATYEAILFPVAYRKFGRLIKRQGPYIIEGIVENDCGHTPLRVKNIIIIQDK
tara:strand:- start:6183 stop:8438 length:2256 start_codon:yes stop_codon:yes gene_type:complete